MVVWGGCATSHDARTLELTTSQKLAWRPLETGCTSFFQSLHARQPVDECRDRAVTYLLELTAETSSKVCDWTSSPMTFQALSEPVVLGRGALCRPQCVFWRKEFYVNPARLSTGGAKVGTSWIGDSLSLG